ncbi:hypothetical protein [Schleiferilactobacillus shenzhenensis]|uniref:WxL domain-containing protein n=1 Tax=Schleiferilactobacillus shenzhenensis LY-73 TaxID=1231336 RepID=U4TRN4_9LACO|nr:hypothetical protein [Schleiferilactobacillus shenzhenensis]ERL66120.1 hypothetical protein L248_1212 [Schleiferilactobacillus shenzhenensis LY-73]
MQTFHQRHRGSGWRLLWLAALGGLFLLVWTGLTAPTQAVAGTNATPPSQAASQPALLPDWVEQAAIGTPYTPTAFLNLPAAQQANLLQAVHPEIPVSNVSQTASVGKMAPVTETGTVPAQMTLTSQALQPAAAVADGPAALSYLDVQTPSRSDSNGNYTVGAPFSTTGNSTTTMTNAVNIGNWSQTAVNALQPSNFTVSVPQGFNAADITVSLSSARPRTLSLTYSYRTRSLLTPEGSKITLTTRGANGDQQALQIVFNIWQPSINRTNGVIRLGNGLNMLYMFNKWYSGYTVDHTQISNIDMKSIDIPNVNLEDTTTSPVTRIVGLGSDTGYTPTASDFEGINGFPWHSSSLMIGTYDAKTIKIGGIFQAGANDGTYLPNYQFDELRHLNMYPDDTNSNILHLTYDGYITDTAILKQLNINTTLIPQIVIHVSNTLQPNPTSDQMQMTEDVTNATPGWNPQGASGLYFVRTFDTAFGQTKYQQTLTGNRQDNAPVRYLPLGNDGRLKGLNEGLFIASAINQPNSNTPNPITAMISYNFNNVNGPDGWLGANMMAWGEAAATSSNDGPNSLGTSVSVNADGSTTPVMSYSRVFGNPNLGPSVGQAGQALPGGTIAYQGNGLLQKLDTGIGMKWSADYIKAQGGFAPGHTVRMVYNGAINNAYPPMIRLSTHMLTVKQDQAPIQISGAVTDMNSKAVNVYYTVDQAVNTTNPASLPTTNLLARAAYPDGATIPHDNYLNFASTLSADQASQLRRITQDGKQHTITVYAIDVPDYTQATALASNVETIKVNTPVKAVLHFVDRNGAALRPTVTKTGLPGDAYNFADFATSTADVTTTPATSLTGAHAPVTLTSGGLTYRLGQDSLPTNAQGTLPTDYDSVDIYFKYATTYLQLTVKNLDFGTWPLPGSSAVSYPTTEPQNQNTFLITDNRINNDPLTLSASLSAFSNGTSTLPYANLTFTQGSAFSIVMAGSGTAMGDPTTIAANLQHSASSTTIPVVFDSIRLGIPGTGAGITSGEYSATVTYSLSDGL